MTLLFLLMSFLQKYLIFNKVKSKKKTKQLAEHSDTCHMTIILATRRLTNSKLPILTHSESLRKDERKRKRGKEGEWEGEKETRSNKKNSN